MPGFVTNGIKSCHFNPAPRGKGRARPPQDEGRSRLGLWLPHRPGEAGSARRASLHRGCGGDTGPASSSAPRPGRPGGVLPCLPRKASRARRPQVFARGAGLSVTTELRSLSDVRRPSGAEVERPHRAHGSGVDRGFWTAEAQPPLTFGLLLSRGQGRAPIAPGLLPLAVPGQGERLEPLHVLPGLGPFPGRLLGAPSGLRAAPSSPKKHPFLFPIKCPPRLLK